ncbi:Fluoroacetate dehalogenase [Brevibacterium casei]|uniref:Fluoroacetate dehalogenase n=1 Tax=Brevibacterium casei TaxID=33889 RepID=A0A449CXT1_9MICO|nr:Fluoroacetate dehalogenase [Brevibacterium casei]
MSLAHSRAGRVAHRLALDSPERVATLTVLDIAPTHAMFTNGRMRTAEGYFHWLLHMQKDLPEALTAGRTAEYLRYFFERWTVRRDRLDPHIDDYVRAFEQPGAMRAAFDDYRATHEDVAVDEEDFRAQRKLTMPVLALWGAGGLAANTDIATVWESYTENVDGRAIPDCGHFIPEEAPETLVSELREFWSQSAEPRPGIGSCLEVLDHPGVAQCVRLDPGEVEELGDALVGGMEEFDVDLGRDGDALDRLEPEGPEEPGLGR